MRSAAFAPLAALLLLPAAVRASGSPASARADAGAARAAPPTTPPGAVLARGEGVTVTAQELLTHLAELSAEKREALRSVQKRRELLDTLIRFKLLVAEARRRGLESDPEVQLKLEKLLVQRLVQLRFTPAPGPAPASREEALAERERRTAEFDAWLADLRERAHVQVDDAALEAVELPAPVPAAPPPASPPATASPAAAP